MLIELVIVIVLIGILFLITYRPQNKEFISQSKLDAAVTQLTSELKRIRLQSMQLGRPTKMVLIEDAVDYKIYQKNSTQNIWEEELEDHILPSGTLIKTTSLANKQIIYSKTGQAYEDAQTDLPDESFDLPLTVTRNIILKTDNAEERSIYISPETGYIF